MITFVLAAAALVGALCVAEALDGCAATEAPPGVVIDLLSPSWMGGTFRPPRARGTQLICWDSRTNLRSQLDDRDRNGHATLSSVASVQAD
jgi:hypothetical protein